MHYFTRYFLALLVMAATAIVAPVNVKPATAQISIQLGGDFGRAKRALINQGYTQIELVGQGFTKFQVEACLNGTRYWFKSNSRGGVNKRRKIGVCQSYIPIERAQQILAAQGYTRINIEDRGGRYIAVACLGNDRLRVRINYNGQIGKRRVLGSCRKTMTSADITASLQQEGYTQIRYVNSRPPTYVAEACLGLRKFRLEVNQFGETLSQRHLGDCRGPIDPRRLASILEGRGFNRVVVIDDRLPRYVAEVCKNDRRLELTLNRYGDVIERQHTGRCSARISRKQVVSGLRQQGFSRINIKRENADGYLVVACHTGQRIRIEFNQYGEFLNERETGACENLSMNQVKNRLVKRNFSKVQFYVQGCKNNKLIRFRVNKFGDRSDRKVLGRCN